MARILLATWNIDFALVDEREKNIMWINLSDAKRHASLLSNFLLDNSLHFGVNEIIRFQKLVGNFDKMTVAN
jgi:hypothetical protein